MKPTRVHPATWLVIAAGALGSCLLGDLAVASRWLAILGLVAVALQRRTTNAWILAAMVAGIEAGYDWPALATDHLGLLSDIFLHLIKCIVAPLLFSTLVVGIAGHQDLRSVGRMGLKAIIYFEVVTGLALLVGLAAINLSQAGLGMQQQDSALTLNATAPQSFDQIVLHVFPENIAKAVAENQVLQVVVFAVMFSIALTQVSPPRRRVMLELIEALAEVMFKMTGLVMFFAPMGVFGAIAHTVGLMGLKSLVPLLKLLTTLYLALGAFVALVLIPIALLWRVPLGAFVKAVAEPISIAFGTSTSEAALPLAMERLEGLGVPRGIVAFVMPTGYSFNLDGTTLYLALASVFVAQAAGSPIAHDYGQQLLLVLTLMLTSKGVAGVPRASLVILMGTASTFNLPAWPIAAILGVDSLMDMARTSINVTGNCLATVVVAIWEGQFPRPGASSPEAPEAALALAGQP